MQIFQNSNQSQVQVRDQDLAAPAADADESHGENKFACNECNPPRVFQKRE